MPEPNEELVAEFGRLVTDIERFCTINTQLLQSEGAAVKKKIATTEFLDRSGIFRARSAWVCKNVESQCPLKVSVHASAHSTLGCDLYLLFQFSGKLCEF